MNSLRLTRHWTAPPLLVRALAAAAFAAATLLFPAKEAQAMSVFEALDKVCSAAQDVCGPAYKDIAEGCFKGSDELKCAVAIIGVSSGGQISSAKIDAILSCVKAGLPIQPSCGQSLAAAGVSGAQVNEAYGLINQCAAVDDVDDAIVCADSLLDSSIADDADLGVPTWVNSLFDVYIDLREKDYWGLVRDVGATVACAVANYFTSLDVCAFLGDIAEIAGDVVDGAKAVGGAINNAGEKIFTNQKQHVPVVQYFQENWLPLVESFAGSINGAKNGNYWNQNVGAIFNACVSYFDSHTMSNDKATRACSDMRDGTTASDNSFIGTGFSQQVMRRVGIHILPDAVNAVFLARLKSLRAQGLLKPQPLAADLQPYDPWAGKMQIAAGLEVPGASTVVSRLYGLVSSGAKLNHLANAAADAWPQKTVGYVAFIAIQATKVEPKVIDYAAALKFTNDAVAKAEATVNFNAEVAAAMQAAQAERVKIATAARDKVAADKLSAEKNAQKEIDNVLALCKIKSAVDCESKVLAMFQACKAKVKAFEQANAGLIGDFDNKQGQMAAKQRDDIRKQCMGEIDAYLASLKAGAKLGTVVADPPKGAIPSANAAAGKGGAQPGGAAASNAPPASGATLSGALKGGTLGAAAPAAKAPSPAASKPDDSPAAIATCKPFLGRADELLCTDAAGFNRCKPFVDAGRLKVCRGSGALGTYPKARP